ncbi:PadR family transcriptional regulator [Saccharothrix sp. ALI-22-I]|uniref:PadR family transcriptional regulator n=1 Tax=Saccharothrix sp. ALI-22-I TaxID=1933778 RepID=UPI00097C7618|nr:PadR family transcriptional regulator [Saccharothrix sp. ALI-22-I]ONI92065.1 PadR family transcriptional regulator [Saccharothrix sp. ALI-22-I]
MARASQTEVAVLGGLSVQPMTGYALREAIRDVLGHFWSESYGQIYPTLANLERQGFVHRQGAARAGASTFAITPSGTLRLEELLAQPIQATPPRNGLLLRLYFGRHLGPAACRTLVQAALAEAQDALKRYAEIRAEIEGQDGEDRDYWLLTVSAGEHSARATQAWAHDALSTLAELDDPARTRPGRTS